MNVFEWFNKTPPVTKIYILLNFLVSLGLTYDVLKPYHLVYSPLLVRETHQYWRIITAFFLTERLSITLILYLHWLYVISRQLEENYHQNRTLDYCVELIYMALLLVLARYLQIISVVMLSHSFHMACIYLWSRRFDHEYVPLYGVIHIKAPFLPYIIFGSELIFNGLQSLQSILSGIIIGHLLWFVTDICNVFFGTKLLFLPSQYASILNFMGEYKRRIFAR